MREMKDQCKKSIDRYVYSNMLQMKPYPTETALYASREPFFVFLTNETPGDSTKENSPEYQPIWGIRSRNIYFRPARQSKSYSSES